MIFYNSNTNFILNYFGEYRQEPCGRCDNCKHPPRKMDGTIIAQKALSAVARANQSLGMELLINVLRGSGMREIYSRGLQELKTFGAGRDLPYLDWKSYITQMINQGILSIDFSKNSVLRLTPFSTDILKGRQPVELVKFVKEANKKKVKQKQVFQVQDDLYEKLREWRNSIAKKKRIPAYTVLTNTTLEELSSSKPTELDELYDINGIGTVKFNKYGQTIIELIKEYMASNPK